MPNIPTPPKSQVSRARERLSAALDWVIQSAGSSVLVAAVAVFLWLFGIQLQYVAGAFIIIFAHRLAQKRLYPEITIPEAPRSRPVREKLAGERDPLEGLTP